MRQRHLEAQAIRPRQHASVLVASKAPFASAWKNQKKFPPCELAKATLWDIVNFSSPRKDARVYIYGLRTSQTRPAATRFQLAANSDKTRPHHLSTPAIGSGSPGIAHVLRPALYIFAQFPTLDSHQKPCVRPSAFLNCQIFLVLPSSDRYCCTFASAPPPQPLRQAGPHLHATTPQRTITTTQPQP